ncbi:MAG TPA: SDR family NAD(P)-dependent oxidoreductase [Rhodospirillales bacterium]|nr:SDR family NAD(P)-dependent oxidoreductase [Rhodospirillales bacterium]
MSALADGVILVTGASRGLGAAVAPLLAREGAHLVLLARTQGGLEETDDRVREAGGRATLLPLDLADGDAVDRLGPSIYRRFGRLDGLVSCAAVLGPLTPVAHLDPDRFHGQLTVNLMAAQRLLRTLDPLLRAAPAGRAVFVTDGIAGTPRAYWGGYAASKAGLEVLVRCYAAEVRKTPLRVNLFDPGPMATRLRADAFPGEPEGTRPAPAEVAPALLPLLLPSCTRHGELVSFAAVREGTD